MGFPTKNNHLGVLWGYHHLRKHPYFQLRNQLLDELVKLFFQKAMDLNPVDIGVYLIGFLKLMTLAQTEVDFIGIPETGHETRREILELLRHRYQQNESPNQPI